MIHAKTMEGLAGAKTNMDLLNTPFRVYKDARRRGDLATMERAMGYVKDFSGKAEEYKGKAQEGMEEDAKQQGKKPGYRGRKPSKNGRKNAKNFKKGQRKAGARRPIRLRSVKTARQNCTKISIWSKLIQAETCLWK